jgi:lysine biosynthesis protein LysW
MNKVKCNDCDFELDIKGYKVKEIIECPSCGCEYEVISINGKLGLKYIELDGEGWGE